MSRRKRVTPALPRIAVLCSGQGTNLQAILNAIRAGRLRARVGVVISDRRDAKALERARHSGVDAHFVNPHQYPTRGQYERSLMRLIDARGVKLICLAGFMQVLSPVFVRHYPHRIVNIHPALLPAFPGAHALRDALAWGVKVTGVTVHFVDDQVDHGPIFLQEAVAIAPRDTEAILLKRIHRIEHRLYPEAIRLVLEGRVKVTGRTVMVREAG